MGGPGFRGLVCASMVGVLLLAACAKPWERRWVTTDGDPGMFEQDRDACLQEASMRNTMPELTPDRFDAGVFESCMDRLGWR